MLRQSSIPFVLAVCVASGCGNQAPKPAPTVTLTSPRDGASLTMKDDVANDVGGLQIDVVATVTDPRSDAQAMLAVDGEPRATQAVASAGTVTFAKVTLTSQPHNLHFLKVTLTDSSGTYESLGVNVTVDDTAIPCTVELTSPADGAVLNASKDVDAATPGLQADLVARSPGCTGGVVRFCGIGAGLTGADCAKAGGKVLGEVVPSVANVAALRATLPEGVVVLAAEHKAADDTVTASANVTVTVDSIVPSCTIVSPAAGTHLAAQSTTVQLTCRDAETGEAITVTSNKSATNPVGTASMTSDGNVTVPVNLPVEAQTLTVTITDKAGNAGTASVSVTVDLDGCDVVLSNPSTASFVFNLANVTPDTSKQPAVGTYALKGTSTRCPDGTATITKIIGATPQELGVLPLSNGSFSLAVSFADGEADAQIKVTIDKKGVPSNAGVSVEYVADFTAPSLVNVIPALGNVFVIGSTDPRAGSQGFIADADPLAAGGQVDINLTMAGVGNLATTGTLASNVGSVTVTAGSTSLISQTFKTNGSETVGQRITLDEGYVGKVLVTLTDAAGNGSAYEWNAKVATVPLPIPTLRSPATGTINVYSGGTQATYARIPGTITYSSLAPAGSQIVLCSTLQGSGAACGAMGYYEIPNTRQRATGSSQTFSVRLPEGTQTLIAELSNAIDDFSDSSPVPLVVDTVPPQVLTLVSADDKDANGVVNGSELALERSATFKATFAGVEDGQVASLLEGAKTLATQAVAGSAASFTVASSDLPDGAHTLRVLVSDKAGNPNESSSPPITNSTDSLTVTFRRVAPTVSVVTPTVSVCNTLTRNPSSSPGSCALDFTVAVGPGADRVDFSLSPSTGTFAPASVSTFSNGQATSTYSLPQSTSTATLTATVYDTAGNTSVVTAEIDLVDTLKPQIAFMTPASGSMIKTQQFDVTVATDAEPGQVVTVTSSADSGGGVGTVVAGGGTPALPNSATFTVSNLSAVSQNLLATVADLAGNPSDPASALVNVSVEGCDVTFTDPDPKTIPTRLNANTGATLTLAGKTTKPGCAGTTVTFQVSTDGGASFTPVAGSAITDSNGQLTFTYTFADQTATIFQGRSIVAGSPWNGFEVVTDLLAPTVEVAPLQAKPAVPDGTNTLFVVAPTGNMNVAAGLPGYFPCPKETKAGCQVTLNVTTTGAGPSANHGTGLLDVSEIAGSNKKILLHQPIPTNTTRTWTRTVTLDQAFQGSLVVTATDYAGNVATTTWNLTVDVVSPPAVQVVTTDPGNGQYTRVLDPRLASADVWFLTPTDAATGLADNGPAGQTLSWRFGYTTSTILGSPAATFTEASFEDPTRTTYLSVGPVGAPGTAVVAHITGVPTFNTLHFAPQLVDGVGNALPIADSTLTLALAKETIAAPSMISNSEVYTAQFGSVLAIGGDLDGDHKQDFAVAAPFATVPDPNDSTKTLSNAGAVTVYYGGTFPLKSQVITGNAASTYLGRTIELADLNGDTLADLAVRSGSNTIKVYLSNGGTSAPLPSTESFSFTDSSGPALGTIKAIPGGVLIVDDLATTQVAGNPRSGAGKVYIILGRTTWPAGGTVDVSAAGVASCVISGTEASGRLGYGNGVIVLPDVDGDGKQDLLIPAWFAGKAYVFGSKDFLTKPTLSTGDALQILASDGATGYGFMAATGFIDADNNLDLLVSVPLDNHVFEYSGQSSSTFVFSPSQSPWAVGPKSFGVFITSGDMSGDGRNDLFISAPRSLSGATVFTYWSKEGAISSSVGGSLFGLAGFGDTLGLADVDGDGKLDLVVGEDQNGVGYVYIYH